MSASDRLEQELTGWLVDAAVPLSADHIDDLLRRTAGVRQRPRWSFLERWLPMSGTALPRPILRSVPVRSVAIVFALVLLVAALIAVGIGSQPRLPAPFGAAGNGKVAFGRGGDIVVVDPATGTERILVAGTSSDAYPAFSPDGTKVAFERSTGGSQLMVVDARGGEPIAVSDAAGGIYGLQWSPDGRRLVFSNGDLVAVDADGSAGGPLPIEARSEGFPMWRPGDSAEILFLGSLDGVTGSYLVRSDGTDLRAVTSADGAIVSDGLAQWTPDGRHILTVRPNTMVNGVSERRMHLMTLDEQARVTDDVILGPALTEGAVGYSLSRDGTRAIAAIPQSDAGAWRVGVIPLDGGPVTLTGPVFSGPGAGFAWAPDGRVIVVNDAARGETWLLDADGGAERSAPWVSNGEDAPAWQPVAP